MAKFIIEIPDDSLDEGCRYCPMNCEDLWCSIHDEYKIEEQDPVRTWLNDGRPKKCPDNCPLIEFPQEK